MPNLNQPSSLEHKRLIISGAPNQQDFINFLQELQTNISDVRTIISVENDSLEFRKALSTFLQSEIDNIKRSHNNMVTRSSSVNDD